MLIYKIFRHAEWQSFRSQGESRGAPVDLADGYIHFSTAAQVPGTLSRHFAGEEGLILLACDADAMAPDLRWEPARDGALFPHLYRSLRTSDISWSREITQGPEGPQTGDL
jgi:uncharacterized protein (DUF952 family)